MDGGGGGVMAPRCSFERPTVLETNTITENKHIRSKLLSNDAEKRRFRPLDGKLACEG